MSKLPLSLFLSLTIITLITLSSTHAQQPTNPNPKPPFDNIYAFGDSFTDTGNTKSSTYPGGFIFVSNPPYGRTFFHRPTNRYSDGRLVIDFIAESLSLPYLPPYLNQSADRANGVNFAVSGGTALPHSFFVANNMLLNVIPQSIGTELEWFNKVLADKGCVDSASTFKECEGLFNESLIWVGEIGANDYLYSYGSTFSTEAVQQLVINSVTDFLRALLKKGAKYVVVQGLPPTGCLALTMSLTSPQDRDKTGCAASGNLLSSTHNAMLKAKLDSFRKEFPQSLIVYADYYDAYLSVVQNPKTYGFTNLLKACCENGGASNFRLFPLCGSPGSTSCPDPSKYINWDGVHLTEAMYKVMANAFLNGSYTQPPFINLLSRKRQSGSAVCLKCI